MRREVFATAAGAGRSSSAPWKVIVLSTFGMALEFYDFIIYGVFASYLSAQFFPSTSTLSSLLKTFAVFAIGYLARPLGGIVLAHFGDRFGRRKVFLFSLLAVSFSTVGMAAMPTYATWGRRGVGRVRTAPDRARAVLRRRDRRCDDLRRRGAAAPRRSVVQPHLRAGRHGRRDGEPRQRIAAVDAVTAR